LIRREETLTELERSKAESCREKEGGKSKNLLWILLDRILREKKNCPERCQLANSKKAKENRRRRTSLQWSSSARELARGRRYSSERAREREREREREKRKKERRIH